MRAQVEIARSEGYGVHWYHHTNSQYPGVNTYALPRAVDAFLPLRIAYELLFLPRLLRRLEPDLVHVFYASRGPAAWTLSRVSCLVVSIMGSDIASGMGNSPLLAPFLKIMLDAAKVILIKSEFMAETLEGIGDYTDKLTLMPWGVDLTVFSSASETTALRNRLKIPNDAMVFFDPRNATRLYNKHVILDAFRRYLTQTGRQQDLLFISEQSGSPKYIKYLHTLVNDLELEKHVRFLGTIPFSEMPKYYAVADVVVSVPKSDGVPQSLYEAMASRAALIVGDLRAYDWLFALGLQAERVSLDPLALSGAMLHASKNPDLRARSVKINRELVEKYFDVKKSEEQLKDLYRRLLSETHSEIQP